MSDLGILKVDYYPDTAFVRLHIPGNTVQTDSTLWYPKNIFEDSSSRIWISEPDHIVRIADGKFRRFRFDTKNQTYDFTRSFQFFESPSGDLFVISLPGFIYRFDEQHQEFEEIETSESIAPVFCLLKLNDNRIWFGTASGIYEFLLNEDGSFRELEQISDIPNVSDMVQFKTGEVLIGTWDNGMHRSENRLGELKFRRVEDYPSLKINSLFKGSNQDIWSAADVGIFLIRESVFKTFEHSRLQSFIHDIKTGPDHSLYVCSGEGITRLSLNPFREFQTENVLGAGTYTIGIAPITGGIWWTNSLGELTLSSPDKPPETIDFSHRGQHLSQLLWHDSQLWVVQENSIGVVSVDTSMIVREFEVGDDLEITISLLSISPNGNLYGFGNHSEHLIFRYNKEQSRFDDITPNNHGFNPEAFFRINDVFFISETEILLATTLGLWKVTDHNISMIDLDHFSNSEISAVTVASEGHIWLGTHTGLLKQTGNELVIFTDQDGLPSKTVSVRGIFPDGDNHLWIGTSTGLAMTVSSDSMRVTPTPVITSFSNSQGRLTRRDDGILEMEHGDYLKITAASMVFPGDNISYQYRILPDLEWSRPMPGSEILLPGLSPGLHQFQVRAHHHGNYSWSLPGTVLIDTRPRWYEGKLAVLAYISGFVLLVWLLVSAYTRRLEKEKRFLEQVVTDRTQELKSKNQQLNREIRERKEAQKKLQKAVEISEKAARIDPLTQLANRRAVQEKLTTEIHRFERSRTPFSIVLCDIDDFKKINDTYGHDCGDEVLGRIARILESKIRKLDTAARWGGEEFLILLTDTPPDGAHILTERIRLSIAETPFECDGSHFHISMTFGISVYNNQTGLKDVIRQADDALYEGKRTGKNRVIIWSDRI